MLILLVLIKATDNPFSFKQKFTESENKDLSQDHKENSNYLP